MRVILDTNVLLAALISPDGAPHAIYRAWRSGRFELITSRPQLDEMRRVSRYPKLAIILPAHRIGTLINNMHGALVLDKLHALPAGIEACDPDDSFLLAMAIDGRADWLITGDRRAGLLARTNIHHTRIATPTTFCAEVL